MKYLLLLLLFPLTHASAQTVVNDQLTIGTVDHLHSKILNEDETIWISMPTSFGNPHFAKARYPVIYVLDGDANFATVSAMAKQLSVRNGNTDFPEVIVVGILNQDRMRDFTPTPSTFYVYGKLPPGTSTGGGENFTAYIQNELLPHIDSLYPTTPYKVLIGHSLGGLAATHIMIDHTSLFNGYVVIDPSMWWDNRSFLKHAEQTLHQKQFNGTALYLGIANNLRPDMDTVMLRTDTSGSTFHPRAIFDWKDALQASHNGLRFKYGYYSQETHMSMPLITIYDGLHFIYQYYPMPAGWEANFFNPYDTTDPAKLFTAHYQEVSKQMGYTVLPSESLVYNFANTAADNGMPKKAGSLYRLNVSNYPKSTGSWNDLGDFYAGQHDKAKAIECYQTSLQLKEDGPTRKKLNDLLKH